MPTTATRNYQNAAWKVDVEDALSPIGREVLEQYATIPSSHLVAHISETRSAAWSIAPYASVAGLTWLNPYITLHFSHDRILNYLKTVSEARILDCGCMIAPDLRYLAYKGVNTSQMLGFDVEEAFFELGFKFFKDREKMHATFMRADCLEPLPETALGQLRGSIDVLWVPKLLHLFNRDTQKATAAKLVSLLRPRQGSMFVGSQNGHPEPYYIPLQRGLPPHIQPWMANVEAYRQLWNEVADVTGTKWDFEARLYDLRTVGWHREDGTERSKRLGYNLQWTATML